MAFRKKKQSIICKYLSFLDPISNPKKPYRLPLVNIRVKESGHSVRTVGLIDSGSTGTFIPFWIAEDLELECKGEQSTVGAGGSFMSRCAIFSFVGK